MRIAVWYESGLGRNDGNPLYVLSFLKRVQYFGDVLKKKNMNQSLVGYFPGGNLSDPIAGQMAQKYWEKDGTTIQVEHLRPWNKDLHVHGDFDLHIWVDWGEDALEGLLPYRPLFPPGKPLVYWASDTHLGYEHRLKCAKQADLVFVAQEDAVERFKADGVKALVHWLPHAVEPLAYPKMDFASKQYDVAFVGHVNSENRIDALERLFRQFPNFFYGQRTFEKAAEIFARSKIVFNIAHKNDLNMRVFEVLGSGAFLLTDKVQSISTFFKDGEDLVLYKDLDDMVKKARYYLSHDEERNKIAESGYKKVIKSHTIGNRVDVMLEMAKPLVKLHELQEVSQ